MAIFPRKLGDSAVRLITNTAAPIAQNPGVIADVLGLAGGSPLDYLKGSFSPNPPLSLLPQPRGAAPDDKQGTSRIPTKQGPTTAGLLDSLGGMNWQADQTGSADISPDLAPYIERYGFESAKEKLRQELSISQKGKMSDLPDQDADPRGLDAQNTTPGNTTPPVDPSLAGKESVKVSVPSNIPTPNLDVNYDAAGLNKARADQVAEESKHLASAAEAHTKAVQLQIDANSQAQRELDMQRQKEIESQTAQEKTISGIMDKHQSLMADVSRLAASGIDPNHYWTDKNAGQRVSGGIAAFLFGISGKGIDYINQINEEVNRDIKVQQMNYENKRASVKDQIEGNQTMYSMARQKGMDAQSAAAAARAGLMQSYAMHLENTKLSGENTEAATRVALAVDSLKQKALAAGEDVAKTAAGLGIQQKGLVERAWEAKMEDQRKKYEFEVKATKAATEKEPNAALKKSVEESLRQVQDMDNVLKEIPDSTAGMLLGKATSGIPGTAANKSEKNFITLRDSAMYGVNHGVLHPDDVQRLTPSFPGPFDVGSKDVNSKHRDQALVDFYNKVQAFDEGLPEKQQFKALPQYKEGEKIARGGGVKGEKEH